MTEKRNIDIKIFSREAIQDYKCDDPHIIISIKEPGPCPHLQFKPNDLRIAELYLDFCDMDCRNSTPERLTEVGYKLFSDDDAASILNFVKLTLPYVNTILVNCSAGISRSAGVGAALSMIINRNDAFFFNPKGPYTPNRYVYRKLIDKAWELKLFNCFDGNP